MIQATTMKINIVHLKYQRYYLKWQMFSGKNQRYILKDQLYNGHNNIYNHIQFQNTRLPFSLQKRHEIKIKIILHLRNLGIIT